MLSVTEDTFKDEVLDSEKPVVVDFWAAWCGPCRMVAPVLERIAQETDKVKIVKLNVDENPAIAAAYGVSSIPTINIYKDGDVVDQVIGAKPYAIMSQIVDNIVP